MSLGILAMLHIILKIQDEKVHFLEVIRNNENKTKIKNMAYQRINMNFVNKQLLFFVNNPTVRINKDNTKVLLGYLTV